MACNSLILSTAKLLIPEDVSIEFITNLINRGLTGIEYFGCELDNLECFVDDDMKAVSESISYFDFHFETPEEYDYESLSKEKIDQLIQGIIERSGKIEMRWDDKDITIYL